MSMLGFLLMVSAPERRGCLLIVLYQTTNNQALLNPRRSNIVQIYPSYKLLTQKVAFNPLGSPVLKSGHLRPPSPAPSIRTLHHRPKLQSPQLRVHLWTKTNTTFLLRCIQPTKCVKPRYITSLIDSSF